MRPLIALCCGLFLLLAGCGGMAGYFRLEEWGVGWRLEVREKSAKQFEARWVEGKHRSVRLANLDDRRPNVTLINTLYLELADDGSVVSGKLKRVAVARFESRDYRESHAQWFKVLSGRCVLDERLNGNVEVLCEGDYVFSGAVRPARDVKKIEHEKKK